MSSDLRTSVRVPVDLWVELTVRSGEMYFQRAANISETGVYFDGTFPLAGGTRVEIKFSLPGIPSPFNLSGEIVDRAREDGLGMAARFQGLDENTRAVLRKFVASAVAARA